MALTDDDIRRAVDGAAAEYRRDMVEFEAMGVAGAIMGEPGGFLLLVAPAGAGNAAGRVVSRVWRPMPFLRTLYAGIAELLAISPPNSVLAVFTSPFPSHPEDSYYNPIAIGPANGSPGS